MGHLSNMLKGLVRSVAIGRGRTSACSGTNDAREAADAMAKDAKRNDMILRSSGAMGEVGSSGCFVSAFSRRGEKGVNQDCSIVWKEFGGQEDTIFCGIFDGHGPWGHLVAKMVRECLPQSLLCSWQETLVLNSLDLDLDLVSNKKLSQCDIWKQSCIRTCDAVDRELKEYRRLDSFYSGTTALTVVKQMKPSA
ncbi:hypothetical protein Taro_013227 [Colocasia esculenta]|uniref:protein-serine/threonine phosphatase n=1 Tax=Colocasia esculenta TaxID=4460 RepID=A0A843UB02_COLES|nr:hypothetical protein [Colocasia esculenta]